MKEIMLQPGEFFFGQDDTIIRTHLGSCVAITMWHPEQKRGGMCHYMLPSRARSDDPLDGRYADEAIQFTEMLYSRFDSTNIVGKVGNITCYGYDSVTETCFQGINFFL